MTALASRRRNRTIVAAVAGVVVFASLPVMGVAAWRAIRDSESAQNVGVIDSLAIPSTPAALLAGVDEFGEVASLTVFALRPEGGGGTIVSVPVGTQSESSPGSARRVADAYTLGGEDALVLDMESLMGVTFNLTAVLEQDDIATLLADLGTVPVTLSTDLRDSVRDGGSDPQATTTTTSTTTTTIVDPFATTTIPVDATTTTVVDTPSTGDPDAVVVVPTGASDLQPEDLAAALTARENGVSEALRLPAIRSIWDGVAARVGDGIGQPPLDDGVDPDSIEEYLSELVSGSVDIWQLGATPITDPELNPEGLDLFKVTRGEITLVMASVAPSAVSATYQGPSVAIDSAFGDADVTLSAIELFHFFQTNVLLIREIEGPPPATSIVRYAQVDGATEEDFAFLEDIIGPFDLELVDTRVEGIDFQVVLGESFVTFANELDFNPSVTTLAPDATTTTTTEES